MPEPDHAPDLDVTVRVAAPTPSTRNDQPDIPQPEDLAKMLPGENYTVEGFLGAGGMGAVYKGTQVRLQRKVAIKIMRRDRAKDQGFEERFRREALAMAQLNHPNIVNVIDYGEAGPDYLYIVMEFIDGTDLVNVIRSGQMTQETALKLLPQICDALQFAHDNGIVHRDIKPANILLTRDGRIKMADFGLAKRFDAENSYRTQSGYGMGTPDYAAPEQFMGDAHVDHRADIYALGVMIYQMVTGTLPRGAWKPPSEKAAVDTYWDHIVARALQTDPHDRYASVSEIKTDLGGITTVTGGPRLAPEGSQALQTTAKTAAKGSTTALTQAGGRPASKVRPLAAPDDAPRVGSSRSRAPMLVAALIVLAVVGYFVWENIKPAAPPAANVADAGQPSYPGPKSWVDVTSQFRKQVLASSAGKLEDGMVRITKESVYTLDESAVFSDVALRVIFRGTLTARVRHTGSVGYAASFFPTAEGGARVGLFQYDQGLRKTTGFGARNTTLGPEIDLQKDHELVLLAVDDSLSLWIDGKLIHSVQDGSIERGSITLSFYNLENLPEATPRIRRVEYAELGSDAGTPMSASLPIYPQPKTWVDATPELREQVLRNGVGKMDGEWLLTTKEAGFGLARSQTFKDVAMRVTLSGPVLMYIRRSPGMPNDVNVPFLQNYTSEVDASGIALLYQWDVKRQQKTGFPAQLRKLGGGFNVQDEHEVIMTAQGDQISVWVNGQIVINQIDNALKEGGIGMNWFISQTRPDVPLPRIKKVEYADLGGTSPEVASQSAVSRTWQAPQPTVTVGTEWTNLIPHIQPQRDVIRGEWSVDEKGLHAKRAEWALCNLPVQDPGTDYDLRYQVTRGEGSHLAMFFAFRKGGTGGYVPIDYIGGGAEFADGQRLATLEDLTHLDMRDAATIKAKRKEWLPRGKECAVLIQVREKEVIVSVNDKEAFRWPAEWSKLQQKGGVGGSMFLDVTGGPIFGVGIFKCDATFHSIEMRKVPAAPVGEPGSIPHLLTSPDYEWTAPVNLGPLVNSPTLEVGTWVSPDGLNLIFGSKREGDGELFESRRIKVDAPWSKPALVFSSVEPGTQGHSWLSNNGLSLYYLSSTGPGHHTESVPTGDVYFRERAAAGQPWSPPVNLGPNVNQPGWESTPRLSKDELTLLFTTVRAGGQGTWDIWRCRRRSREDSFGPPENLGPGLNTSEAEHDAMIAADDRTILFLRGRDLTSSRLLMATPDAKGQYQATALDFPVVGKLSSPWLSADGRTLWFAWDGTGSVGDMDLWETRRVPKTKKNAPMLGKTSASSAAATKDTPFINTLGMKFVPVPIIGGPTDGKRVLFSIWPARAQDFDAFLQEQGQPRPKTGFEEGPTHPAIAINWFDAQAFCSWLTARERAAAKIGAQDVYRLPSDHEWSCALGMGAREDAAKLPAEKHLGIPGLFPWGTQWPPPKDAGNFAGEEMKPALAAGKYANVKEVIAGYNDGFVNTSPVGSFPANPLGLHDLTGNVWQWCEDWADGTRKNRVLRGGSSQDSGPQPFQLTYRNRYLPEPRFINHGFRVVLEVK
jgi:serine/threonine protein kinase